MTSAADKKSLQVTADSRPTAACGAWVDAPCVHVTRLAARILGVPVALLSMPRAEEYRFRVNIGLDGLESVPSRISFCAYTMLGNDVLFVSDARVDARFHQNPLVLGPPYIVSYVGAPLISSRGVRLGTLCAIDYQPRTFTSAQIDQLRDVARIAASLLEAEIEQSDAQDDSRSLLQQLEDSRDAERERLAIALHEGVAQDLFALRLQLQQLRTSRAWRPEGDSLASDAGATFTRALDRSIGDVCEIANGLFPQGQAQRRLAEEIRQQAQYIARHAGLEIQFHEIGIAEEIEAGARLLLLRATREALANVARQPRICNVSVTFECAAQALRLRVMDDGMGVHEDVLEHRGGRDLAELRGRTRAMGGTLEVERNSRGGTTLLLQLPRKAISSQ